MKFDLKRKYPIEDALDIENLSWTSLTVAYTTWRITDSLADLSKAEKRLEPEQEAFEPFDEKAKKEGEDASKGFKRNVKEYDEWHKFIKKMEHSR